MADPRESLLTTTEFAQRIKAQYPAYASVPDEDLAQRMLEKYPEYKDRVVQPDFKTTNEPYRDPRALFAEQVGEAAKGAIRGAVSTVQTLAKPIRWAAGMAPATPPPAETTTAGTLGRGAEQLAEVLVPGARLGRMSEAVAAKVAPRVAPFIGETAARFLPKAAVEAAGQAGIAAAQGGDPRVAGALGAVTPAVGAAVEALPTSLKEAATKQVVQALGPTKERFKAIAERLAPKMLERGLRGSREALQAQAANTLSDVGDQLDTLLTQRGPQVIQPQPILDAIETSKDAFRTTNAAGKVVEFEPRAIKQLSGLQQVLTDLGPNATVEQLVAIRRAWDKVVSQAGGFEHRASGAIGVPLKDISEAWAKREATGAIRELLAQEVPDLDAINKEWAFWKDLNDVLRQTMKRTQPQSPGLTRQIAEMGGAAVGGAVGSTAGPAGAAGGAALGKLAAMAQATIRSPQWRLASAQAKDRLAEAIIANDADKIAMALARITSTQGAKLAQ
jgi:hypothetical protein